jgi:hypothetical protein
MIEDYLESYFYKNGQFSGDLNGALRFSPPRDTCRKQQFGCSLGCTHTCSVESSKEAYVELYNKLRELKEKYT